MCGRFTLSSDEPEWVATQLEVPLPQLADYRPRYNVAPMQRHWIVRAHDQEREATRARWGLVNVWAKDNSRAARQINARGETVAERPAFRSAFRSRRCIVPADGFYEWSGPRGKRQPHWITPADGGLLMFAGLYEDWYPEPDLPETTFTIITTAPNATLTAIHNRMPVILSRDDVADWLFTAKDEADGLQSLLAPAPDELLQVAYASPLVGPVKNDGPELLRPAS